MVPQTISHYRLERRLGAGGMGEVYLAEDTTLSRRVAIKFLAADRLETDDRRRRLLREAKAAASLDHPNICSVFEVGSENGRHFIVMQYVSGETLAARLERGPLSAPDALETCAQVADALAAAHEQGILHRDIKPQNIIVTPRGVAKVLDFGLAKMLPTHIEDLETATGEAGLTEVGTLMGTAPYMAPEQVKLEPLDHRADLFALGAVLYECLTGRRAFTGKGWAEVCGQVLHVDPPPPSRIVPALPARLDGLCRQLLAKNREQRFRTAEDCAVALRGALHATPEVGSPTLPSTGGSAGGPPAGRASNRSRATIGAAGVAVALIAAYAILPRLGDGLPAAPPEAQRWFEVGTAALRQGSYLTATKALEEALAIQDPFPLAHARLAEAQAELDESDLALASMLHATTNLPDRSRLEPADALYLDAITASVSRDFDSSIAAYTELTDGAPDRADLHFDLGRAQEADDRVEDALRSYQRAIDLDPLFAPAFMRRGVLQGRQQQFELATESFERAEALYQASSNFEGVATTIYHRGALLNSVDRLVDARTQLERALELATATDHPYLRILALKQLTSLTATEGDFEEAQRHARAALELARGRPSLTAAALIDLGNVFLMQGDYESTERQFLQAFELADRVSATRAKARAQLSLGSLAMSRGQLDEALRYTEAALPFYREGRYRKEIAQGLAILGNVLGRRGDLARAEAAFEELAAAAVALDDPSVAVLAHDGLGYTLARRGRFEPALRELDRSVQIYEEQGNRVGLGYALLSRCDLLWRMGRTQEAAAGLDDLTTDPRLQDVHSQLRSSIDLVAAYIALSERRFAEVVRLATDLVGSWPAGDPTAIEVEALLGLARVHVGAERRAGLDGVRRAAQRGAESDDAIFGATLRLFYAEALLAAGDAATASAEVGRIPLDALDQPEIAWRGHTIATIAAGRLGDSDATRASATRARAALDIVEDLWEPETFQRVMARPDVARLRRDLARHDP